MSTPPATPDHAGFRARRLLLAAVGAGLLVLGSAAAALAHDELIDSDPDDGEVLTEAPQEMVLTFSGDIQDLGPQVRLTGASGTELNPADLVVSESELRVGLDESLAAGEYGVAWRVVSADGHPIAGEFSFTVEAEVEATTEETATSDPPTSDPPTQDPTTEDPTTENPTSDQAPTDEPTSAEGPSAPDDEPVGPGGAPTPDEGGSMTPLAVGGGVLLAAAGAGYLLLRRRQT